MIEGTNRQAIASICDMPLRITQRSLLFLNGGCWLLQVSAVSQGPISSWQVTSCAGSQRTSVVGSAVDNPQARG
jgi:hypothetical protein